MRILRADARKEDLVVNAIVVFAALQPFLKLQLHRRNPLLLMVMFSNCCITRTAITPNVGYVFILGSPSEMPKFRFENANDPEGYLDMNSNGAAIKEECPFPLIFTRLELNS